MPKSKMVGIVTVTYGSGEVIDGFMQSLLAQSRRDFRLYLVDNASNDDTLARVVRYGDPRVVIIANSDNRGVAEGNNQGIRPALADGCESVLLINNDTEFGPDLLDALCAEMDRHHCDMIVPKIYYDDDPSMIWCAGGYVSPWRAYACRHTGIGESDHGQYDRARQIDHCPTCCMLIRAEVFERIGLMDAQYFVYFDDADFCMRAREAGFVMFYTPLADMRHKVSRLTGGDETPFFHTAHDTQSSVFYPKKRTLAIPFLLPDAVSSPLLAAPAAAPRIRGQISDTAAGVLAGLQNASSPGERGAKRMTKNAAARMLSLVGAALWIPGWSLLNIAGAWGVQIVLALGWGLAALAGLAMLGPRRPRVGMARARLAYYGAYLVMLVCCTVFSAAGLAKSGATLLAEMTGTFLSLTMAWWLCQGEEYSWRFFSGFRLGGLISAGYAIYQQVGLRLGLPLSYVPMNNDSFTFVSVEASRGLQRAFAVTPEPSILASLLLPLLGMMTVDVVAQGGLRRYVTWVVVALGFLATGSQSVVILPFYLIGLGLFLRSAMGGLRPLRPLDLYGIMVLALGVLAVLATNAALVVSLGRIGNQADNVSAETRFADVLIGLEMFREKPLFGFGLGSSSMEIESIMGQLGLTLNSGGITSGLLRVMAEQGLAGLATIVIAAVCIVPRRMVRRVPPEQATLLAYQLAFVVGEAVVSVLFVGYRNLYSLWLTVPIGLAMNYQFGMIRRRQLGSAQAAAPVLSGSAQVSNA